MIGRPGHSHGWARPRTPWGGGSTTTDPSRTTVRDRNPVTQVQGAETPVPGTTLGRVAARSMRRPAVHGIPLREARADIPKPAPRSAEGTFLEPVDPRPELSGPSKEEHCRALGGCLPGPHPGTLSGKGAEVPTDDRIPRQHPAPGLGVAVADRLLVDRTHDRPPDHPLQREPPGVVETHDELDVGQHHVEPRPRMPRRGPSAPRRRPPRGDGAARHRRPGPTPAAMSARRRASGAAGSAPRWPWRPCSCPSR